MDFLILKGVRYNMKLNDRELLKIKGGSLSATMINALVKGINIICDLGRSLGSTIRRISENKPCGI